MSGPGIMRPLGGLEYAFWIMDLTSRTNFAVVAETAGELPDAALRKALDALQARHPLLRSAIAPDAEHGACFVPCPEPIPLRTGPGAFEAEGFAGTGSALAGILRDALAERFDPGRGPLLRCLSVDGVGRKRLLVLAFHHAIADGVSGVQLALDLLEGAEEAMRGREPRRDPIPEPGPLERRLDPRHRGALGRFAMLRELARMNLHKAAARPLHVPEELRTWPDERSDRFVLTRLDRETTRQLADRARACGCSVHGALAAAQLLAIAAEHPGRSAVRTWQLSLVDLRKRVDPAVSPQALGLMISTAESCHRIGRHARFWPLALEIQREVGAKIASGYPYYYLPQQMRFLRTRMRHRPDESGSRKVLRLGQRTRPMVSSISNLGRIEPREDRGLFRLEALHFAMPLSSSGLFASSAITVGGRLFWNFTYAVPAVSPERAERIARRAVDLLGESLGESL